MKANHLSHLRSTMSSHQKQVKKPKTAHQFFTIDAENRFDLSSENMFHDNLEPDISMSSHVSGACTQKRDCDLKILSDLTTNVCNNRQDSIKTLQKCTPLKPNPNAEQQTFS